MFRRPETGGPAYKIPQIGWNILEKNDRAAPAWRGTLLEGLGAQSYVYFVHSFIVEPEDEKVCLATTPYGRDRFCSVLQKDNMTACQFHPERSGEVGMKILDNFLKQT